MQTSRGVRRLSDVVSLSACVLMFGTSGCSGPMSPDDDRYILLTIAGTGLPVSMAPMGWPEAEVAAGTLLVAQDRTDQRLTIRCIVPPGPCEGPDDWSRLLGELKVPPVIPATGLRIMWRNGGEALLTLAGDTAWLSHPLPGENGRWVFRFER